MAELVELLAAGLKAADGTNLASGYVLAYSPGTLDLKSLYTDAAATTTAPVPVNLDSTGVATVYGVGTYRFRVYTPTGGLLRDIDNVLISGTLGTTVTSYLAAAAGQASIPTPAYTRGNGSLKVYWQGSRQTITLDYTEAGTVDGTIQTTITLVPAAAALVQAGDRFLFEVS